jgi:hypothetical protein
MSSPSVDAGKMHSVVFHVPPNMSPSSTPPIPPAPTPNVTVPPIPNTTTPMTHTNDANSSNSNGNVPLSQSRYVLGPPSPFERAGWLNLITVWWASGLIVLGNSRPLQEEDVPELPNEDRSEVVYQKFQEAWQKTREGGKAGSVWRALFIAFGRLWMIGAVHCVLSNVFAILQPIFVRRLVEELSDDSRPLLDAYMWSLALIITTLGSSLFLNQMFTYNIRAANGARVGTLISVYDKSLRLSRAAKQAQATGTVVNIQSNDTSRLFDCILVLHFLSVVHHTYVRRCMSFIHGLF